MRRALEAMMVVTAVLSACGGQTLGGPSGRDGGSSSSSGGSSGGSSGSSSGGSSSSSGGSGSSSGGADAGRVPTNHRPNDSACTAPAPPGNCPGGGGNLPGTCDADAQCTSGADGRCIQPSGGIAEGCQCTYDACADDAACPTGQTCACHGSPYTSNEGNTCVPGDCRVDADCGAGGYCSPSSATAVCGASIAGYYCHTPQDECLDDSDCPTSQGPEVCAYSTATGRWQCSNEEFCG